MTTKELIESLSRFPPETEAIVVIRVSCLANLFKVVGVHTPEDVTFATLGEKLIPDDDIRGGAIVQISWVKILDLWDLEFPKPDTKGNKV